MKVKVGTKFAITSDQGVSAHRDGELLPITPRRAKVVIDYQHGGVPVATIEGYLMDKGGNYELDVEAEMIVVAQNGRRYRLVEVTE